MMPRLHHITFVLSVFSILYVTSCGSDQMEEVDCAISGPSLEQGEVVPAGCQPTGSITVTATGGNGELLYSLDGISFQASPTFADLSGGDYTVTVVDAQGCMDAVTVAVTNESSDLNFTASTTTGGCGSEEGSIEITATGGAGDYTYRLGTGNFITSSTFENISGGSYNVSVKDAEGCIHSGTVKVQSGVSFSTSVKPIIDNNCSVATCHGEDPTIPVFSTWSDISGNAQRVRSQVSAGTMPPDDELSQNQIDLILCWIDDGAVNN